MADASQTPPQQLLPGLTPEQIGTLKTVFSSPLDIPTEWLAWLVSYLEANPPQIPLSQVFGYKINAFGDRIWSSGGYVSADNAGYGDASDGLGPELTELPDGTYVILFGCSAAGASSAAAVYISLSINGAAAVDADNALAYNSGASPSPATLVTGVLKQLSNKNKNTLKVKYKNGNYGNTTMSVNARWILALRVA